MQWEPIRQTLKTLVAQLTGLQTLWRDEPRPFVDDWYALLTIKDVVGKGTHSEMLWLDAPEPVPDPGEEIAQYERSERVFTLSVRVEAMNHLDASTAWEYVEALRSGLYRRTTAETMATANLGLIEIALAQILEEQTDERYRSIAIVDVRLRHQFARDTGERDTHIETTGVTGGLEN